MGENSENLSNFTNITVACMMVNERAGKMMIRDG